MLGSQSKFKSRFASKSNLKMTMGLALIFAIAAMPIASHAQKRVMKIEGGDVQGQPFTISELGAIVVSKSGKLEIVHVMDKSHRPKAYAAVDIQAGDLLVMLNGKRLKSIDDLKAGIEEAKVGKTLKFGIKRDKDMRMISFPKGDPKSLPNIVTTTTITDDGAGGQNTNTNTNMNFEGDIAMLKGSGIIANETEDGLFIGALLPGAVDHFGETEVSDGDRIISLQGEKITDLEQLSKIYDKIATGEEVTMTLAKGKGEYELTFKKRDPSNSPNFQMKKG